MRQQFRTATSAAGVLLLCAFAVPYAANAADKADSDEVSSLLSSAKTQAYQVREDAAQLEAFTRTNASWESHAATVGQMREHINALGKEEAKLAGARDEASPWQQVAIDRIRPLLKELASNTEATINFLNKNRKQLTTGDYKDYVEANADLSSRLSEMIGDFVDYGRTKDRLERLTKKLEVPSVE
ncbi:MAG TPA: hypothetical protein VHB50_13810 [Bryobacteraceae bacterium]|nr:hypothetical protein [Bryobacteraceae bacterium]